MYLFFLVIIISVVVYHPWFLIDKTLSSGDWPYLFVENIKEFSYIPHAGDLWLVPYYKVTAKFAYEHLGISWNLIERVFWYWLFLLIAIFSSRFFTRSWIGVIVYTTNTYILMVLGGGQMGVAMAYAISPLVLKQWISCFDKDCEQRTFFTYGVLAEVILLGMSFALLGMFDMRIAYVIGIGISLYFFFQWRRMVLMPWMRRMSFVLLVGFVPIGILLFLNSFWLIPYLYSGVSVTEKSIGTLLGFQFLSFATFSNAISLLHANWPENIFGKIYFMKPEFLLLPIAAFSLLLFKTDKKNSAGEGGYLYEKRIFFLVLLLLGAFLAKGTNPPFGEVNQWMFGHIPGMGMFRDPTKFYVLIAISYSFVLPMVVVQVSERLAKRKASFLTMGKNSSWIPIFVFLLAWAFLIRQSLFGMLGGTFKPSEVPKEYIRVKEYLLSQNEFFQTLWIPSVSRFGFHSVLHPAIGADEYLVVTSIKRELAFIQQPMAIDQLRNASIKYVVVPYDARGELFLSDRKYDDRLYQEVLDALLRKQGLKEEKRFGKIVLFAIDQPKKKLWIESKRGALVTGETQIDILDYRINLSHVSLGDRLIFTERFDPRWVIKSDSGKVSFSEKYLNNYNQFVLPSSGSYAVRLYYEPQRWVFVGLWVSIVSLTFLLFVLLLVKKSAFGKNSQK